MCNERVVNIFAKEVNILQRKTIKYLHLLLKFVRDNRHWCLPEIFSSLIIRPFSHGGVGLIDDVSCTLVFISFVDHSLTSTHLDFFAGYNFML